ncbi:MAG: hypothetical protein LBM09_00200, partial [Candidatus Nomurabacteria bacterium]|nr:hypothetical protein [Candidatus Nomurabacteria bacterium]
FESLDEEAQKLAMTAWIWGIQAEEGNVQRLVKLVDVSVQENVRIKTTKLRELKQKRDFNIVNFIASEVHERAEATYGRGKSIFDLWRDYSKADNSVQEIINENTTDFNKWQILVGKISEIKEKSSEFVNNYDESMEVGGEVSFPMTSYYTESNYNIGRPTWVWKRTDGAKKFGLDSEAEEKWANILQDLADENNVAKITMSEEDNETNTSFDIDGMKKEYKTQEIMLWGKNFLGNSEIKFEYYMNGKYSSYPDFVMKDTFGRIHIFEVKSMNRSAGINMDDELYREKIKELEKAYKRASELTNQIFYIPIDGRNGWEIMQYIDGKEMPPLDENSFKEFILSGK